MAFLTTVYSFKLSASMYAAIFELPDGFSNNCLQFIREQVITSKVPISEEVTTTLRASTNTRRELAGWFSAYSLRVTDFSFR